MGEQELNGQTKIVVAQLAEQNKSLFSAVHRIEELLGRHAESVDRRFDRIEKGIKEGYVPKTAFQPVRALVYGAAGLILTAVVVALTALVINQGGPPS